ncbi:MAG TPA: hypothetical protein VER96_03100 [Polyangiaceae bacterium]|nr:hypothetical protein [Polyangiaceae bacterium]
MLAVACSRGPAKSVGECRVADVGAERPWDEVRAFDQDFARQERLEAKEKSFPRFDNPGNPSLVPKADPKACECVAKLQASRFEPARYQEVIGEAGRCLGGAGSDRLWHNQGCLPLSLGLDPRNQERVELEFICGDLCPDNGKLRIAYPSKTHMECKDIAGLPAQEPLFREYDGCIVAPLRDSKCK